MQTAVLTAAAFILAVLPLSAQNRELPAGTRLVDDFSAETSTFGTSWEGISDRVMGGVADIQVRIAGEGADSWLHMSGQVSLENRGGFIQVRMRLDPGKKPFAAGEYEGIALRVRGREKGYYVHLRTTRTIFPWSYYAQEFAVTEEWQTVYLPFREFKPEGIRSVPIKPDKLVSIASVAAKREFAPDLDVDSVLLYR